VVVDDGSTDATWQILEAASGKIPELVPVKNPGPHGFGRAIQKGLATASGDAMVIMMADESDDCRDVVRLNDTTNAFKAYRREVIEGCLPILSPHFNITVELPLKAIVRGYSWKVIPITWRNRRTGVAKLKIREMGSRYFFIVAYVWLEKYFSRGDYRRR
jgi:dolichol-phosphate mannosyltransferase